ncbi:MULTISPECIES: VMAP-C domain-containing protein [Pseudofrankia]|uniref:VMAP-C domain-containing protein n=1 Tax=Pseudofrankia TaxID=2994363 RepID=UPI001041F832|nr:MULTISPECIES: hypothetical protein [Pseudofrankia]
MNEQDRRTTRRRAEVEREIADVLRDCPSLQGEVAHHVLVGRLLRRGGVSLSVPAAATDAIWFLGLIGVCQRALGGFAELACAVEDLRVEQPTVDALARLADRWEAYGELGDVPDGVLHQLEVELRLLTPVDVSGAYRHTAGDSARTVPAYCDTAWAALLWLFCQNASPPDPASDSVAGPGMPTLPAPSLPPSMTFLEAVKDALSPATAGQVDAWNRRRARDAGLVRQLDEIRLRRDPQTREPGVVHLIFQFELRRAADHAAGQPMTRSQEIEVACWRQWPRSERFERVAATVCTAGELPRLTSEAVVGLEEELRDAEDLIMIEFILSHELLHLPVEHWQMEYDDRLPSAIGLGYPLALRSLERQRRTSWHRRWRRRWRRLAEGDGHGVHWDADNAGGDLSKLYASTIEDENTVAVALSGPPRRRGGRTGRELNIALQCGVPIIMWHRGEPTHAASTALRAFLDGIEGEPIVHVGHGGVAVAPADLDERPDIAGVVGVRPAVSQLTDLRDRAQRLRARAYRISAASQDLGWHLALIWDDPDRQPERVW